MKSSPAGEIKPGTLVELSVPATCRVLSVEQSPVAPGMVQWSLEVVDAPKRYIEQIGRLVDMTVREER